MAELERRLARLETSGVDVGAGDEPPATRPRLAPGPAVAAVLERLRRRQASAAAAAAAAAAVAASPAMPGAAPAATAITSPLQLGPQALLGTVSLLLANAGGYGLRAGEVARMLCSTTQLQPNMPSMLLLEYQPAAERTRIHEQVCGRWALCGPGCLLERQPVSKPACLVPHPPLGPSLPHRVPTCTTSACRSRSCCAT